MSQYSNWGDNCPVTAFVTPDLVHRDYHEDTTAATFVEFKQSANNEPNSDEDQMSLYVDNLLDDAIESRPDLAPKPLLDVTNQTDE